MTRKKDIPENYYITTAIDYVNSTPHIGTAYEKIGADAIARFYRFLGSNVLFQMGNDEHSINVKKAADREGIDPKTYCDRMEEKFIKTWKDLNISYDGFIRTTDPDHHKSVQKLFKKIEENGDIYKDTYKGWYCESCEAFLTDKDLEEGKCPNHKTKPKWLEEDNYFFALSKYQDKLLTHIKKYPEFILPEVRRNEVIKIIEGGLNDISVSRSSFDWGIPLPNDKDHVVYVWVDALINYITAVGFGDDENKFKNWWPADIHIIGKDIIRFHCIIWPAMLMSASLPLPKTILAHGFVYLKGEKMSKSLGNVVKPLDITKNYGPDPLRYYLLREVSFGKDADFTWEHFIERYNGELANGIGNLVSRTSGMINKYLKGKISPTSEPQNGLDVSVRDLILKTPDRVKDSMMPKKQGFLFNQALSIIWESITAVDKYINENKPWELNKAGREDRIQTVLSNVVESIRIITVLLHSFIPETAEKIWDQFGFDKISNIEDQKMEDIKEWPFIKKEFEIGKSATLFPRIEEEKEDKKVENVKAKDNLIDISDFAKIELKVAEIRNAEKVEGADKLLKLKVSLGDEERQIVAGLAKVYSPDELVGKKIAMVTNLKPAKLRGIESQGMLLAASKGNNISILTPLKDIPAGAKIK